MGEPTLYVQDRWANEPWANGILGEQVRGRKFFGRTDCHSQKPRFIVATSVDLSRSLFVEDVVKPSLLIGHRCQA